MEISYTEIVNYLERMGFDLKIKSSFPESRCKAQVAGILMPFEQILLRQYLLEGNQSVKNFLDYLIEKRLPELSELGWVLHGNNIISPNDLACSNCPDRFKCHLG